MADTGDEFVTDLCRLLARRYGLPVESPGVTRRAQALVRLLSMRDGQPPDWDGYSLIEWREGRVHKVLPLCLQID
jgi:hypothetical protein